MANDFRIYFRPSPRDSYEDDHTSSWNNQRWTPQLTNAIDRKLAHTIIERCFKCLQTGNFKVWWNYFQAHGRAWYVTVFVGNQDLSKLGKRRLKQAMKQLAAKMRRLLNQKEKQL
jgi:hypothetical protein